MVVFWSGPSTSAGGTWEGSQRRGVPSPTRPLSLSRPTQALRGVLVPQSMSESCTDARVAAQGDAAQQAAARVTSAGQPHARHVKRAALEQSSRAWRPVNRLNGGARPRGSEDTQLLCIYYIHVYNYYTKLLRRNYIDSRVMLFRRFHRKRLAMYLQPSDAFMLLVLLHTSKSAALN